MSSFVDILLVLVFIKKIIEIEKESSPIQGEKVSIADLQTFQSHDSATQPILEPNNLYCALSLEPSDNPMNLSRHPMHKEDREEQHQWLEGIKNSCAITTFEISNPLFFSIYKNFKRAVVDAYVYNKYCRSRRVN